MQNLHSRRPWQSDSSVQPTWAYSPSDDKKLNFKTANGRRVPLTGLLGIEYEALEWTKAKTKTFKLEHEKHAR